MPLRLPRFPSPHWSPEQRSTLVFAVVLGLALLAVAWPGMPPQALQGILWAGAGLLMFLLPPTTPLLRAWWLLAGGFLLFSLAGFLPRGIFVLPAWRRELETLGLDTGHHGFVQTFAAAEGFAGFAVTTLVGLFLLGHRVGSRGQQRLALAFVLGVAVWTAIALGRHQPEAIFGFFPNRNHSATLMAMGFLTTIGCLVHAIDRRQAGGILLPLLPLLLFFHALCGVSESRSGVVLLGGGLLAWIPLAGIRSLRGHAGKAVLLLLFGLAAGGLMMDSPVKQRLWVVDGVPSTGGDETSKRPWIPAWHREGRIPIYQDTWTMIRSEPWCGVGPGDFPRVFPQYRQRVHHSSETPCLHPESDWFQVAVEQGWVAAASLVAGVFAVLRAGFIAALRGRSRALRTACLVAGSLLGIHGMVDVPGHQPGLVWAAALLVALSFRPEPREELTKVAGESGRRSVGWRCTGLVVLAVGLQLLHAWWTGGTLLPSTIVAREIARMEAILEAAPAAGEHAPPDGRLTPSPPHASDLEHAMSSSDLALRIHPLDPRLHYLRGALLLRLGGPGDQAAASFAIQRHLSPFPVGLVLDQAKAWGGRDHSAVAALWEEAMARARRSERHLATTQAGVGSTYGRILVDAGSDPALARISLELAGNDFELLQSWTRGIPPVGLDRHFPEIPAAELRSAQRAALLAAWRERGSSAAVEAFLRDHPGFSGGAE